MLDVTNVSFHIGTMRDDVRDQRWVFGWALPASLALHLLIVGLLVFGLPVLPSQPQKEQAIAVDLVPPKPSDKARVEPPPSAESSEPEKPAEANGEKPSSTSNDTVRPGPSPVLRPVFQYGEKDAGPREAQDGNSAEDGSASPVASSDPDKPDVAELPAEAADEATNRALLPEATRAPAALTPRPADATKAQSPLKLEKAKRLFSPTAADNLIATTAMSSVPRGVRAGRVCVTELREQLLRASPPYLPDLLPSDRLKDGTTVEIPNTAFRANGQWYNLSYRCEVDVDATRVVSFAFRVGETVPRSEWKRRGLPSQ